MQVFKAFICQLLAFIGVLALKDIPGHWGLDARILIFPQAFISAFLSVLFRQPVWWRLINLGFMPAVILMLALHPPSWVYLAVFLLLTLIYWRTVMGDAPLFLSSSPVADAVHGILDLERARSFVDIGAGVGSIIAPLAGKMPDLLIDGLETAPLPWLISSWRCREQANVNVKLCDFWRENLMEYHVVFAFLSPLVMEKIAEKTQREMRNGSLFISSSFPAPNWRPEKIIEIPDEKKTLLYCYRIGSSPIDSSG